MSEIGIAPPCRRHILPVLDLRLAQAFMDRPDSRPQPIMLANRTTRSAHRWMIACAIISLAGCALDRMPRIDPSGRQLLLFPDSPPAGAVPLAPGQLVATPPNTAAPPVYSDSSLPGALGSPVGSVATTDALGRTVIVGPPVSTVPGAPLVGNSVAGATVPRPSSGDVLRITPSRILAPVGSEVILRAGVCAPSGYLRTNERIEWMLDRAGTGHIVTVGARGELDITRMPWNTPRKIDNFFAIGATSPFPECIDRGTPDPSDDVQIRRGDAWLSISSPSEGTSYINAYAPDVKNWAGRTARATIYWVDAQWAFPPSVTLAPGQSHTLTTTVTRQSDGAPIAGWIVRYHVSKGGAGLGYAGEQTSEVTTNNRGQASVEISPTDSQAGATHLAIEIIRPEQAGAAASPRVTLGSGAASITWADGGIAGSPLPPSTPPPILPPVDAGPLTPPAPPSNNQAPVLDNNPPTTAAGRPDLFVRIEQKSPGPFHVDDEVEFLLTVVNQGDGVARNVKIVDDFNIGLTSDHVLPGVQTIETRPNTVGAALGSGESMETQLTFRITQAGRLSHSVTVTADNAVAVSERAYITVEQQVATVRPSLRVGLQWVEQQTVGDLTTYRITVENRGSTAATNVLITNDRAPELSPTKAYESYDKRLFSETRLLRWSIARLEPGAKESFEVRCECLSATQAAFSRVELTADGLGTPETTSASIEIRSLRGAGDLGSGAVTPPPATSTGTPMGLVIDVTDNPARLQQNFVVYVLVENKTNQTLIAPKIRVLIPTNFQADRSRLPETLSAEPKVREDGGVELIFTPANLGPGEKYSLPIVVTPVQQGIGAIWAEASANGVKPTAIRSDVDVIGR